MAKKQKAITVSAGFRVDEKADPIGTGTGYRIEEIRNSVAFTPGKHLTKKEVEKLCESDDWLVTIIAPKA